MSDDGFASVAILGLGAMGGSLARGLSALESPPRVTGWSPRREEREAALSSGAVSAAPETWQQAVVDAELVVLAAPLNACCALVGDVLAATPEDATLTAVASLKAPVARAVADAGGEARWVGSHPMTGSEASGFAASRSELYQGARVWTVAHAEAATRASAVSSMWASLGARPEAIDAEEHDRLMALASQLPQLVSNALAKVLAEGRVTRDRLGPGGREMTRLAGSGPAMWRDILAHASPELVRALRSVAEASGALADLIERGDLDDVEELMNATRTWSANP